jgi:hypothetical protein
MVTVDSSDLFAKLEVFRVASARWSAAKGVEAAAADIQRMAQFLYWILLGMLFDGRVL